MGIDVTADISAAHADEYARRAQTATPDEVSALFYEALGEGQFAAHVELDRLRAEVELDAMRVGSLTAEVEAQRKQISALVAEVERLERERDAEREVGRVYHDLAEQLKKKSDDSRRAALEEAARIAGGVEITSEYENWTAEEAAHCIRSNIAAAIRAAAKEEKR